MDKMDQLTNVRAAAKLTGLEYRWLQKQVNGFGGPPTYVLPGGKRKLVVPREVVEWVKKEGIQHETE